MDADVFLGRIEVRPPLNESERGYLVGLATSSSSLRGTPTGRGDQDVPFARLAWEPCPAGCCLTWSSTERTRNMLPSLRFLVDHLFKPGAKVLDHPRFPGFTCDHVLDGLVAGRRGNDDRVYVTEVTANRATGRSVELACEGSAPKAPRGRGGHLPRPANVIELRPGRA